MKREKILIVDDNATNIEILQEYLEEDYELATALSGEQALDKVFAFQPAVILLDIMMPGLDGYEVCRRIRANPDLRHTKIIMVSVKAMLSERLAGYAAGADDYVTKPFDEEELLAKVRVYMRLKAAEDMEKLKSDLLSLLSHETRTPLNRILVPVEMLLSDNTLDIEKRTTLLDIIRQNAQKLQNLFDKIQLLSTIKSGADPFHFVELDFAQLVRTVMDEMNPSIVAYDIQVDTQLADAIVVHADKDKMRYVLWILLEQAIQLSLTHRKMIVSLCRNLNQCELLIQTHGRECPVNQSTTEATATTLWMANYHLSLALVDQIVHIHKGFLDRIQSLSGAVSFVLRLHCKVN